MDKDFVELLRKGSVEEVKKITHKFIEQNSSSFQFPQYSNDIKKDIYESLITRLNDPQSSSLYRDSLSCIRILSREKTGLEAVSSPLALATLLRHAHLVLVPEESEEESVNIRDTTVVIEAQKCLCNILFNSPAAQRVCSSNNCVEGIVQRLKTYKDPGLVHEIKYFDMRLLFVLTALVQDVRPRLRQTLHGLTYLIEVLDLAVRNADESGRALEDEEVDLSCEVLKILFNLTNGIDSMDLEEEEEAHFMRLVSVIHDLLTVKTVSKQKQELLASNAVNLLTQMPRESYEELLTPINEVTAVSQVSDLEYDGKNMEAIVALLQFLDTRLSSVSARSQISDLEYDSKNMEAIVALLQFFDTRLSSPGPNIKESLSPILHCLSLISRSNRSIRNYCRHKVLPYLRSEVKHLPEEGNTLRNRLCKLFTSPVTEIKTLAADFLFVLCKENVGRFIKYTGYGNAAGLLAQRGLLCGGPGKGEYSSESEDSETEEYEQLKDGVNPVTGRWEESVVNPMEGMTEEQKEYEAMKLVNQLDKLQRAGIIQPSRVEDGRPVAVSHVLELMEGVNINNKSNDDEKCDDD